MKPAKKRQAVEEDVRLPSDLVRHPRFGMRRAHTRRNSLSIAELRARVWQIGRATPVPGTVIEAREAMQNYTLYPRRYYVDLLKACKTCSRPFVFHALEQKYWYEVLRFNVDVDCVKCTDCRRREHWLKPCLQRYSRRMYEARLDAREMKALVDDAIVLLEQGVVRNLATLGALRKRAQREIGPHAAVDRFARLIAQARQAAEMRPGAHLARRHRHRERTARS